MKVVSPWVSQPYFGRVRGWLPHSQNGDLGVRWDSQNFRVNCRGQNTLHRGVFYIIGKLSKFRCRKWARMSHLDICSTSYDKKKGRGSNCQFDSQPLKVRNRPNLGVWRWNATHRWKDLDEGYNFALDLIVIGGLHRKLCALKVVGVSIVRISRLPFGSLETRSHLDVAPVESCRVYYMGEGGGFPRI
jgi:hypothetical protein